MDRLTRTDTLLVLQRMGVDIPSGAKLSDESLDKRLRDALDAAQYKERYSSPLDLDTLSLWPVPRVNGGARSNARPLLHAVDTDRGNLASDAALSYARNGRRQELYFDPFVGLRLTIMEVVKYIDKGIKWCTVQDQQHEDNMINLRFVSVLEVDAKTPAIVVLYRAIDCSTAMDGARWMHAQSQTNSAPSLRGLRPNIQTRTPLEKLLLTLLDMNRCLVPETYQVKRHPTETDYELSVLLPLGPLDFAAIAQLSYNMGCSVCAEPATNRCLQCQSVSYCGAECQRVDWSRHKNACRQLKGGLWRTLPVHPGMQGMDNAHIATINRFTSSNSDAANLTRKVDTGAVPPNVWGDRVFVVKIQVSLVTEFAPHMMVYDRKRSFQVFVRSEENPELFHDVLEEMRSERGGYGGIKMYRWARRTGDWELTVCLDRRPPQADTLW